MPRAEGGPLRRSDTRAALAAGAMLVIVLLLQGLALSAFVGEESLERADDWFDELRELAETIEARELPDAELADAMYAALPGKTRAVRVLGPDGTLAIGLGEWPPAGQTLRARHHGEAGRGLGSSWRLRADRFLTDEIALPSGARLQIALPLRGIAGEAWEMYRGIAVLVAVSSLFTFAAAFVAARRAFAPLREATALLSRIDARTLGARLPTRHTGDPIDRHAETLNHVLEGIDRAFSRLRDFSADVAHEFRTPLNRTRTVAEVALASGDPAEQRAALERVEANIDELARLVDSLLLIAEAHDRRIPLALEPLDVDAWLALTVEAYAPLFEERGAKLALYACAGTISADRTLLDRVLLNLLENALRHGAGGGRVEIHAERRDGGVSIAIDDAGPGIPAEERERVFERFQRVGPSERGSGGVGLTLARAVARLLGGDIVLETSPLGGARFVFWLPEDRPAPLPQEPPKG